MNKFLVSVSMLFVAATAFTGCAGEEDDIFPSSAAERLNESSAKYSARLMAQPNGWAMQYYPTYQNEYPYGSGYLILMDFDTDFSVRVSMDNPFSGNAYATDTSPWEVISDNGPVLTFNGFNNCMHAFSDPEDIPWTSDNERSEGCGGDYEFIIVDAPEDASYMMLKGKKRNTYNLLTPIEPGVDYAEYLADVKNFHNRIFPATEMASNLIHFGDTVYRMDGSNDGLPNIYPYNGDAIANESFNPFLITKRGEDYYLRFRDGFKRNDMEGTLQELRYDTETDQFVGTDNDKFRITGFDPMTFFQARYMNGYNYFNVPQSIEMSDSMKTYFSKLSADFNKIKEGRKSYKFNGLQFLYDFTNNVYVWNVMFTIPGATEPSAASFVYEMTYEGDNVTYTYQRPLDDAASLYYETISSVKAVVDMLSQTFRLTPATTGFDLKVMRLTSVSAPDLWLNFNVETVTKTDI